ncbi:MAG: cell division protein ZapA [Erythrobacter sp.]|jgi:cell division protein ZapA|uniref:cell division protein ZapA n=1 Tax=Erythrobacter sp. TaxID=1042 RepID=UPI002B48DE1F|nr:cell division protein ZapA [Erythrobacter sp.]WRH70844.1 MAG: cell division protein ZapA [Erythrobacter sp.]
MSTVTLTIGPKSYAIACADGQEAHITALGAMIAEKYAQLGSARAPLEAQNLLFAALFLADELAEAKKRLPGGPAPVDETPALRAEIAQLQEDLAAARKAAAAPRPAVAATPQADLFGGPDMTEALAERLEALATRAEASAAALEALVASA